MPCVCLGISCFNVDRTNKRWVFLSCPLWGDVVSKHTQQRSSRWRESKLFLYCLKNESTNCRRAKANRALHFLSSSTTLPFTSKPNDTDEERPQASSTREYFLVHLHGHSSGPSTPTTATAAGATTPETDDEEETEETRRCFCGTLSIECTCCHCKSQAAGKINNVNSTIRIITHNAEYGEKEEHRNK